MNHIHEKGIIALITTLVVGAVVLVVAISISTRSIGEINMSLDEEQSNQALVLATSCMEVALSKLSNNTTYTGNETITIGTKSCIINTIESPTSSTRVIKTSGTFGGYTRRLSVAVANVTIFPIQVTSWQEVSSF